MHQIAQRNNLDSQKGKQQGRGGYKLHNVYDQPILVTPAQEGNTSDLGAVMSELGCQSDEAARVAVKRHQNVSNTFTKFSWI